MKHYLKTVLTGFLLAMAIAGCHREAIEEEGSSGNTDAQVTFTFELPAQAKPTTRANETTPGSIEENKIENIYVLAFDKSDKFSYHRKVTTIIGTGDDDTYPTKSFSVSLKPSEDATDTYTFVLIANVDATTETQIKGLSGSREDALKALTYSTNAKVGVGPTIPMASQEATEAIVVTDGKAISNIKMIRMAARIDVQITDAKYRITEVSLFDYNICGSVYAHNGNWDSNDNVTTTSLPTDAGTQVGYKDNDDNSISPIITTETASFEKQLYTFEAAGSNKPCLVIRLQKNTGTAESPTWTDYGYYKALFEDSDKQPLDILRNHRYVFSISDVNAEGFRDKEDAYNSVKGNFNIQVIDWNNVDLPIVGSDGPHILAVNWMNRTFKKDAIPTGTISADDLNLLKVYTDYANGWEATVEIDEDDEEGWLTLSSSGTSAANSSSLDADLSKVYLYLKENTDKERTATIKVTAGNIKIHITVTQTMEAGDGGNKPYTFTATNSSKYVISSTKNFTFTSTGNWKIESVTAPDGTSLKVNSTPLTDATGIGSGTPVTVTLATGSTTGTVSITFECTNGYFSNWGNNDKATISFEIATTITYNGHNGWAGSNIYWDEESQRLTFDGVGQTTNQKYQGVFFKWGSLVGLQSTGNWNTSSIVYSSLDWINYIGPTGYSYDDMIPYVNLSPEVLNERERHYLLEMHDPEYALGDICKYITDKGWAPGYADGVKWRMPTAAEFRQSANYSSWYSGTTIGLKASGTGTINSYRVLNGVNPPILFPSSGFRFPTEGSLVSVGTDGCYWSASPSDKLSSFMVSLDRNNASTQGQRLRTYGLTVRCVRE